MRQWTPDVNRPDSATSCTFSGVYNRSVIGVKGGLNRDRHFYNIPVNYQISGMICNILKVEHHLLHVLRLFRPGLYTQKIFLTVILCSPGEFMVQNNRPGVDTGNGIE